MTWPTILGVIAPPEDDFWSYSDYRKDRVWQALEKIARKRGIQIDVIDFKTEFGVEDEALGFYINRHIVINKRVPNWYKPNVLAHELAHHQLHRDKLDMVAYLKKGAYYMKVEQEAQKFAERLIQFIKHRISPQPKIDKSMDPRVIAEQRLEKQHQRLMFLIDNPDQATPEEKPLVERARIILGRSSSHAAGGVG